MSDTILEWLQKEDEAIEGLCHLSLNALSGIDSISSMKVRALLKGK